jgi:hypothetical protein
METAYSGTDFQGYAATMLPHFIFYAANFQPHNTGITEGTA